MKTYPSMRNWNHLIRETSHTNNILHITKQYELYSKKFTRESLFSFHCENTRLPITKHENHVFESKFENLNHKFLRTSHWILRYHWTVTNWTLFAKKVTFWSIYLGVQTPVGVLVMSDFTLYVQTSVSVLVMSGFYLLCSDTRGCVLVMSGFYLICCNIRGEKNTQFCWV